MDCHDYRMGTIAGLTEIGRDAWNALVAGCGEKSPFLSYDFLEGLERCGCVGAQSGWQAAHLVLWDGEKPVAASPQYLKAHSYGEYVFDWAWADAYSRHDLEYYPKWLCALPFSPVGGRRLLGATELTRRALARGLLVNARQSQLSSLHVLFPAEDEARLLGEEGLMLREGVQFHWHNRGYHDFDEFAATLERKKRRNIAAERRKVDQAGITLLRKTGAEISASDWRFFVRCYETTYHQHYSSPYLNAAFFEHIGRELANNLVMVSALRDGKPIASSLALYSEDVLYGRYWGAIEHVPCLHFECAYYQLIEFCIERGIAVFEGGAQGEHKMARGFLPQRTWSAHWLAHPAFADAVERFLERESSGISRYLDELNEHTPFRATPTDPA
jgi:uncharacterized protein